eukprot:185776_1
MPTDSPIHIETADPSHDPSEIPSNMPTDSPIHIETADPSHDPSEIPSNMPTDSPIRVETRDPSHDPTFIGFYLSTTYVEGNSWTVSNVTTCHSTLVSMIIYYLGLIVLLICI